MRDEQGNYNRIKRFHIKPLNAKQTVYVLLAAAIFLGLFLPWFADARPKSPTITFSYDPELNKPQVIYRPYPHEFKRLVPKLNRPVPKATPAPTANKPVATPHKPADSGRNYDTGEVQNLIRRYAQLFGIAAEAPLCIAKLESGFNPNSKNRSSSASGVFQYLSGTWKATDEGKAGYSVLNADANVKAAIKYMAIHKNTRPWTLHTKCPPLQFL